MLSRTADSLYWLSRYVERAECLARILDATYRLGQLPQASATNEWASAIATADCLATFHNIYDTADERSVTEYLAFSPLNPSSIRRCFEIARANARAVRTALTVEMWDAINGAWYEIQGFDPAQMDRPRLIRFLDYVKEASIRFDGSAYRTMLRNDGYWFSRLGVLVERADATARILDVKYHVLLPREEQVGGPLDYFQWASILRSVSALTSYHWVYRNNVKPWLIADLLILNTQMPRSLASCYENITRYLGDIGDFYGRQASAQRSARALHAKLTNLTIDQIFQNGLHEFIRDFIGQNADVGVAITEQYLT